MPDVNDEWAKFESEVINKETTPQKSRRTLYAWLGGMSIAASLLLFFVLSMKDELAEDPQFTAQAKIEKNVVESTMVESAVEEPIVESPVEIAEAKEVVVKTQPKTKPVVKKDTVKMLPAQLIAQVRAYEQKSDADRVTGIDDGREEVVRPLETPRRIEMREYEDLGYTSVDDALQGRISGLEIVERSGNLGAGKNVRVRGTKPTDDDDSPLVVINGVVTDWKIPVWVVKTDTDVVRYLGLQYKDVTDIRVLKDESATALYGHLGRKGVLDITTKTKGNSLAEVDLSKVKAKENYHASKSQVRLKTDLSDKVVTTGFSKIEFVDEPLVGRIAGLDIKNGFIFDSYVLNHPEMKKDYRRIEGYILDEDNKPLEKTFVRILEKDAGTYTDSTGYFYFWVAKTDTLLQAAHVGYVSCRFHPKDTTMTIHLRDATKIKEVPVVPRNRTAQGGQTAVLSTTAQTENPRGIYKMMTLTGKQGEIRAPFDQYKICTDSVTLMMNVYNSNFGIQKTDKTILNYTGALPKDDNDKSTRVYDSNAERFTMAWWSRDRGHLYFPENGWCIEKYEANMYSKVGRLAVEALTKVPAKDKKNPLLGTWHVLGWMDELKGAKKQLKALREKAEEQAKARGNRDFFIFMPQSVLPVYLGSGQCGGAAQTCEYPDKNTIRLGNDIEWHIKWLSKDVIAIERQQNHGIDWQIVERVTDSVPMLNHIAAKLK